MTSSRITEQIYPSQTTTKQTKKLTQATASTTSPTTKRLFSMWCKKDSKVKFVGKAETKNTVVS